MRFLVGVLIFTGINIQSLQRGVIVVMIVFMLAELHVIIVYMAAMAQRETNIKAVRLRDRQNRFHKPVFFDEIKDL